MNKYAHAMQHGLASLVGWIRLRSIQPEFAGELLRRRWRFLPAANSRRDWSRPTGFCCKRLTRWLLIGQCLSSASLFTATGSTR